MRALPNLHRRSTIETTPNASALSRTRLGAQEAPGSGIPLRFRCVDETMSSQGQDLNQTEGFNSFAQAQAGGQTHADDSSEDKHALFAPTDMQFAFMQRMITSMVRDAMHSTSTDACASSALPGCHMPPPSHPSGSNQTRQDAWSTPEFEFSRPSGNFAKGATPANEHSVDNRFDASSLPPYSSDDPHGRFYAQSGGGDRFITPLPV